MSREVGSLLGNADLPIADVLQRAQYPPEDIATPHPLLRDLLDRLASQQVLDVQSYLVKEFSDKSQLHRALRLTSPQQHRLTHDVSCAMLSTGLVPCRALRDTEMAVSSGCPVIDKFLKGGFQVGQITELCGQSATGKTQLCVQTSLYTTLPGGCRSQPEGSVVYIVSEDFPHRRLYSVACHLCRCFNITGAGDPALRLLDRLHIRNVRDPSGLWLTLQNLGPFVAQTVPPVRLVVVDSIAALFRGLEGGDAVTKADQLFRCAAVLRRIATQHRLAVLVANQVTGHFGPARGSSGSASGTAIEDDLVVPALGLSWSSCLNTRLMLSRSNHLVGASPPAVGSGAQEDGLGDVVGDVVGSQAAAACGASIVPRRLAVVFSPNLDPSLPCPFYISEEGVAGTNGPT